MFKSLHEENLLEGLAPASFGARAGFYLAWINNTHPFREGNGRTQRLLISQLAHRNGHELTWESISASAMVEASRAASGPEMDTRPMERLVSLNTHPSTEALPRVSPGADLENLSAANPFESAAKQAGPSREARKACAKPDKDQSF